MAKRKWRVVAAIQNKRLGAPYWRITVSEGVVTVLDCVLDDNQQFLVLADQPCVHRRHLQALVRDLDDLIVATDYEQNRLEWDMTP